MSVSDIFNQEVDVLIDWEDGVIFNFVEEAVTTITYN